jgi:hypothetical protein
MDARNRNTAVDFTALTLNAQTFPLFHRALMQLRFPIPVSQVLELRYLINHAVDRYREPPLTADHRQFRAALTRAIDSFGVDKRHNRRRLLKLLALLRELHVTHSLASRDAELSLRERLARNRTTHERTRRFAAVWLTGAFGCVSAWLLLPDPALAIKAGAAASAWLALRCLRLLPRLDAGHEELRRELNSLLRVRVSALNWKALIHKLSLVLGYKQVRGVEVFRPDSELHDDTRRRLRH